MCHISSSSLNFTIINFPYERTEAEAPGIGEQEPITIAYAVAKRGT